jgi:hypothetical protein
MIFTLKNLPKSYVAYKSLKVCSNTLSGGGHIASIGDTLPLIIGKGDKPQIWLQALTNPETKQFTPIVESSVSKHPAVVVKEVSGYVVVSVQGTQILKVKAKGGSANVEILDLRPLGLNLSGNSTSMNVGGNTFSNNSMSGGGVLISLG